MADKINDRIKRIYQISGLICLAAAFSVFVALQPMSVNFLKYLLWKTITNIHAETGYIESQGAHIHYDAYGVGQPILLLHGGLADKFSWFSQIPWLVESGRKVVLIDTRGHGNSTHGEAELSYEIFAEDTLKVLDKLKIKRTDIVGWSDGGIIALLLGLEAPERVGRIVAISANFHPSGLINENEIATTTEEEQSQQLRNELITWMHSFISPPNPNFSNLQKELNHLWQTAPLLTENDLYAITAPTLIITGENDIIQLSHSADLAQMLRYGKIEVISGAGHAAPVTHAPQVNDLIASFLGIEIN
jgi:pimeloyl-ACP methyl ester carboxylesterase